LQVLVAVGGSFVLIVFLPDSIARAAIRGKRADKELTAE
jgi:hypothetical protein